jgi:hypothetical protein
MLLNQAGCSFSLVWDGASPIGNVSVEGSDDFTIVPPNAGSWNPLPLNYLGTEVTLIPLSGNTGKGMIDVIFTAIGALRLHYFRTSGTGELTVELCSKVV